jgi:L-2,4-diaminobutyric acid acetyltransferase
MEPADDGTPSIILRPPRPTDGQAMWAMARDSGTLDLNSPYAYVLVGEHFAATSVVAVDERDRLVGFVSAYQPPSEPDAVFVWQVAVDPAQRGAGIGRRLLHEVIAKARARGAVALTATVTPSNEASRRLFQAVATDRGARYEEQPLFDADLFPGEGHEPEHRIHIGPV